MQKSIHYVLQDAEISSHLIEAYEHVAYSALTEHHDKASRIVKSLQNKHYENLVDIISKAEDLTLKEIAIHKSNEITGTIETFTSKKKTLQIDLIQEIENIKKKAEVILNDSKCIFRAGRSVLKTFQIQQQNINSMKTNVKEILTLLSGFVNENGASRPGSDSANSIRHSMLQSPNDRMLLSRNIINAVSAFPDKLLSSIKCARLTIKAFETALKQVKEPIASWESKNSKLQESEENHFEVELADFTVVHDAESVLDILKRMLAVAKAENSLIFFQTSPSTPRDQTEVENIIVHLKEALKVLLESEHNYGKDIKFIDLCYNRPNNTIIMTNKKQFPDTLLLLDYFSRLFPQRMIAGTKKAAEIQLVELQLFCADEEARLNSARFALKQAIVAQSEVEIAKALQNITENKLTLSDSIVSDAEKELTKIRNAKRQCQESLKVAIGKKDEKELEETLLRAEKICLPPSDAVVVTGKRVLATIRFRKSRYTAAIEELQKVSFSNDVTEMRNALARARACQVSVEEAFYVKVHENLERHLRLSEVATARDKKFYDNLAMKLGSPSDESSIDFKTLFVGKRPLSSRHLTNGRIRSGAKTSRFTQYIQREIDAITLSKNFASPSEHLRILLKYAAQEKEEIPLEIVKAAEKALETARGRQEKALTLKKKCEIALEKNSFTELASIVACAQAEPELLECKVSENKEELYDLTARAKEVFALLSMERKSEEEEKVRQQISLARRNLKKAMVIDSKGSSLREAVNAFRLVCKSISPRSFVEVQKEKKLIINPEPITYFYNAGRTNKTKTVKTKTGLPKQQERFLVNTQKLYRVISTENSNKLRGQAQSNKNVRPKTTASFRSNAMSAGRQAHIKVRRVHSEKSHGVQENSSTLNQQKKQNISNVSIVEKTSDQQLPQLPALAGSILRKRPTSALEPFKQVDNFIPYAKLAWEKVEDKNLALLRKAEKNLKRIEREEEKQKADEEKKEFLNSIKGELVSNLRSSIESGDR